MIMRHLLLIPFVLLSLAGCELGSQSGGIGVDCDDTSDCDDDELACVPLDEEKPAGARACLPPPEDWTCDGELLGDGACDCGCGFLDLDCANELATSCANDGNRCRDGESPVATDNTSCA